MQTYSNASNARRAAKVLADKHDNLQSEPSVQAEDGNWYPAVSVTIGAAAADVLKVAKVVPSSATPKETSSPRDKVDALLAKTVANGCTRDEMIAAQQTARALCEKHGIDQRIITWPNIPDQPSEAPSPEPTPAPTKPARKARNVAAKKDTKVKAKTTKVKAKPKTDGAPRKTKAAQALEMMSSANGATAAALEAELGWQPHTLRGWASLQNKAWREAGDKRSIETTRKDKVTTYSITTTE